MKELMSNHFNKADLSTYTKNYLRQLITKHNNQIKTSKRRIEIYEEELEKRELIVDY